MSLSSSTAAFVPCDRLLQMAYYISVHGRKYILNYILKPERIKIVYDEITHSFPFVVSFVVLVSKSTSKVAATRESKLPW